MQRAQAVVAFAAQQIGKPYCWGGRGPVCFDCSGLAQSAWRAAGARLPRTSWDIAQSLPEVPLAEAREGDILWWPGHVGIYAGSGWVIDALDRRHGVVLRPAKDPYRAFRPDSAAEAALPRPILQSERPLRGGAEELHAEGVRRRRLLAAKPSP
jgi:cell wall-associated NlpC family hydrolase